MDRASVNKIQPHEIQNILKDIIIDENIIDPVINIKQGSEKGDNFSSLMTIVDVIGKNKELNLILKRAPRDSKTRELLQSEMVFAHETYLYTKVLPAIVNFQKEKEVENIFDAFPKCYTFVNTPGEELIVLENLKENGYSMTDRKVKMDEEHLSLVLKEYGKFHAVSFALKDQKLELFSKLSEGFLEVFNLRTSRIDIFETFLGCAEPLKELFAKVEDLRLRKIVDGIKDSILPFFKKVDDFPKENGVIVHGDSWSNNMMFKYENHSSTQVPRKVCFFDFQISKVLPPVIDLSYFLYTNAPNEVLDELEKYLRIYYTSLQTHLKALGSDAEELYPFSKLMDGWKEYGKFGFIMSLLLTRVMLCDDDEIKDFGDVIAENKTPTDIFVFKNRNEGLINERLKYLVMHMYENCYF